MDRVEEAVELLMDLTDVQVKLGMLAIEAEKEGDEALQKFVYAVAGPTVVEFRRYMRMAQELGVEIE